MVQIDPESAGRECPLCGIRNPFSERAGRMSQRHTSLPSLKSGVSEGWSNYALGLAGR